MWNLALILLLQLFLLVRETNEEFEGAVGGAYVECGLFKRKDLDGKYLLSVCGELTTVEIVEVDALNASQQA